MRAGDLPGVIRGAFQAALSLALLLGLVASPSGAHDDEFPIDGESVLAQGPPGAQFTFESRDTDIDVRPGGHDPQNEPAWVMVRGDGVNGGRTRLIPLEKSKWAHPDESSYVYNDDPDGTPDGIMEVVLEEDHLLIRGSGSHWSFVPGGSLAALWVYLRLSEELYCARFPGAEALSNDLGHFESESGSADLLTKEDCWVCGNGKAEPGEECDDGNLVEDDGCTSVCTVGECTNPPFASTYDALQTVIFDAPQYGCTTLGCHDVATAVSAGELALNQGVSYDELLQPEPATWSTMRRVEPLAPQESFLYRKLAASVPPGPRIPLTTSEKSPMPLAGEALHPDHLEALRLWILKGASDEGVVDGTQTLLAACLPEASPTKISAPDPPSLHTGVQLRQPPWPLYGTTLGQGEDEICMATYYDVSALVPESARVPCVDPWLDTGINPENECFAWNGQLLLQDPQSHHSIITIYDGDTSDPQATSLEDGSSWWGPWSRKVLVDGADEPDDLCNPLTWADRNDPPQGCLCDPLAIDPQLGYAPGCSGRIQTDVACIGFGPPDGRSFGLGGASNQLLLAQQARHELELSEGVFTVMPVRGIMHWNSHAFNRTSQNTTLSQYLNLYFAEDQDTPSEQMFAADWIFAQSVKPFEQVEICGSYTIPQGAHLFQLSSHTHERGVNWRTWAPPNGQCRPPCLGSPLTTEIFGCELTKACETGAFRGVHCSGWGACDDDATVLCKDDRDCPQSFCLHNPEDADVLCGGSGLCKELPLCESRGPDSEFYHSTTYSDPLNLIIDPPLVYDSPDPEHRTFLFCSEFDNGATGRASVKLQSTSPEPPLLDLSFILPPGLPPDGPFVRSLLEQVLGGPCPNNVVACVDGPRKGELCGVRCVGGPLGELCADHSVCDSAPGAGDGICDACPAHGGITTEDEMFILLGNYFVPAPEPSQILLGLSALGTASLLARRGRRRR